MSLLQRISEARRSKKIQRGMRILDERERHSRLKKSYDKEYDIQARKSVELLAKKKAHAKYGYTKQEKRARSINSIIQNVESMGDMLGGNQQKQQSRSPQKKRSTGQSKQSKQQTRRKKSNDPLNIDMGNFDVF